MCRQRPRSHKVVLGEDGVGGSLLKEAGAEREKSQEGAASAEDGVEGGAISGRARARMARSRGSQRRRRSHDVGLEVVEDIN
jgi:hypothetical protein